MEHIDLYSTASWVTSDTSLIQWWPKMKSTSSQVIATSTPVRGRHVQLKARVFSGEATSPSPSEEGTMIYIVHDHDHQIEDDWRRTIVVERQRWVRDEKRQQG